MSALYWSGQQDLNLHVDRVPMAPASLFHFGYIRIRGDNSASVPPLSLDIESKERIYSPVAAVCQRSR